MEVRSLSQSVVHKPTYFTPKIPMEFSVGGYIIKTASCEREIEQIIGLREEVFLKEFASGGSEREEDWDQFDEDSDFLIIKSKKTNDVLASYRIMTSDNTPQFYSESEFNISNFLASEGIKLELSRACVRPDKRTGIAIHLLWKGIGQLIRQTGAKYIFGLSSVKTFDIKAIMDIMAFFDKQDSILTNWRICPNAKHSFLDQKLLYQNHGGSDVSELVPPLLRSYVDLGAKVAKFPAMDLDFGCIDFLTVLDVNTISGSHARKYLMN